MPMTLPPPVAAYFAASTPQAIAATFTEDALVTDERRTHRGRAAILAWREEVAQIAFQQEILRAAPQGDGFRVTCRVSGSFPGSPVELDYDFRVAGNAISRLQIR
ncbi:nuclear transport factor 2 family protein [Seohaeicola nanhaiensis]|uniref:Nuclear transport factor 2 family protein n=1 Tax=Seohaeicola nanhaiensis TaxID=1387282 RepID=A0ABV9KJ81_9RHOB